MVMLSVIVCWLWQCLCGHLIGDCLLVVAVSMWSCDRRLFIGCGSVYVVMLSVIVCWLWQCLCGHMISDCVLVVAESSVFGLLYQPEMYKKNCQTSAISSCFASDSASFHY